MLNAVAEQEKFSVTQCELDQVCCDIAQQCELDFKEVLASIDIRSVKEQLLRDKARNYILDNAITL